MAVHADITERDAARTHGRRDRPGLGTPRVAVNFFGGTARVQKDTRHKKC